MATIINLILLTFTLLTECQAYWWTVGNTHVQDVSPSTLMAVHKFTRTQRLMVDNTPELLEIIGKGAAIAIKECQKQFLNRRWNCSSYSSESVFGKILNKACRETAFIHGITSAGVTYTLTENCAKGFVKRCHCNGKRSKRYWINESCTNPIGYGYQQGKIFVDSKERSQDFGAVVNLHNNEAGRLAVVNSMKVQCKCHGLSGNCNIQMCRKVLPLFTVIGRNLKEHYDVASKVVPVQKRGNRRITRAHLQNENEVHRQSTSKDLIYFEESPDFCTFNLSNGSLGTRGRYCNASLSAKGVDGCELLCCGRDWTTETRTISANCKCRFRYCCAVECEKCEETKTYSYCN